VPAEWQCQAETVAPSAVPSAGMGPLPGLLACPPECCEAAAVSAAASAGSVLGSVGLLPHSTTPLLKRRRRAKNLMGNIITQLHPEGVARGGGFDRGVPELARN